MSTYVDGGGLREEVEEVGAPSRGVLEGRGAADGDHEQGTQGGLVQVRRLALRHLDARDAKGPHVHLEGRGGGGVLDRSDIPLYVEVALSDYNTHLLPCIMYIPRYTSLSL